MVRAGTGMPASRQARRAWIWVTVTEPSSFSDSGVNIAQAHCLTTEDQRAVNTFEVMVQDLDQLQEAMKKIRRIKGVYRVERA